MSKQEVQFVVSVLPKVDRGCVCRDHFVVKIGLEEVGEVYKISPGPLYVKDRSEIVGLWAYESDDECSLELSPVGAYETRMEAVFALLARVWTDEG